MRKNIFIVAFLALIGLIIVYMTKLQANKSSSVQTSIVRQMVESMPMVTNTKTIQQKEKPSDVSKNSNIEKISSNVSKVLYKTLSIEEAQLSTKQKRGVKALSAFRLNTDIFTNIKKGDTVTIPDIEGLDYTLVIKDVQTYKNGSTSTTAQYEDEGVLYTTTITHSLRETFITLATPKGVYEMETERAIGYVYKSSDIRKKFQKSNINDAIVLPIPKRKN